MLVTQTHIILLIIGSVKRMSGLAIASPLNLLETTLPAFFGPVMRLRNPVRRPPWLDAIIVQFVDLFEGKAFGFGDEEVCKEETAKTCRTPDEKHLDSEASVTRATLDEIRGGVSDSPVPQPIGRSGHRHRFGTDALILEHSVGDIREGKVHQ